jgi:hypothetical protein
MNAPEYHPGVAYRVELPGGEFVQLIAGQRFETHLGPVEFPAGESFGVIELDCTNVGGFKFAGLAHDTPVPGRICEWSQVGGWVFYPGPLASPVCYDAQGKLHYEPIPASDGGWSSQGYRYSDAARVYTGDETFALPTLGIWEYSRVHGIAVGQGHEGGVHVAGPDNVRRVLGDDNCIRVKPRTDGVRVVVSGWAATVNRCVTWRGMLSDLLTLPPYVVSAPPVTPIPPIVTPNPPSSPKPEPKPMMTVQNRADALTAFWQQWNGQQPIVDDAEKHKFTEGLAGYLNALDGDWRWGRKARAGSDAKSKDTLGYWLGSSHPTAPIDGKVDAFDVVASSGVVSWDLRAEQNDPGYRNIDARWFPVAAATTGVPAGPTPTTPLPTATGPGAQIDAEIAALLKRLVTLENKVAEVAARPVPTPSPTGLSGRIALKTNDGHYLCAEAGGGGEVNATRGAVGGWETFTVEPQ